MAGRRLLPQRRLLGTASSAPSAASTVDTVAHGAADATSTADFAASYFDQRPLLVKGMVRSWPAFASWPDFRALSQREDAQQIVPVEFGANYMEAERNELPLSFYLDYLTHIEPGETPEPLSYMAQVRSRVRWGEGEGEGEVEVRLSPCHPIALRRVHTRSSQNPPRQL